MWTLIVTQLRYSRLGLGIAAAVALLMAIPLALFIGKAEALRGIWQLVVLVTGVSATFVLWAVEQKERRLVLWGTMPLSPREIAAGRLLLILLVQVAAAMVALLGMWLALRLHGLADPHALTGILATLGFALLAAFLIHLQEELTILVHSRRLALMAVNVVLTAFFVLVAFNLEVIFLASWKGVVLGHALAAVTAAANFALFVRRPSYLVGISPLTGLPKDLSEAPAGR